jgi:hypothetical protein
MNSIKLKFPWFKRVGLFYIPASLIGWLMLSGGFVYAVYTFISIDRRSHSVSDTMINFVFSLLIIGAVYSLIGYLTSRSLKH